MYGFSLTIKTCALLVLITLLPSLAFSMNAQMPAKLGCMMCHQHTAHLSDSARQHVKHAKSHKN